MGVRVRRIDLGKDDRPTRFTVVMDMENAAEIVERFGKLSPATGGNEATSELYDALSSAFNCFWDNGVDGFRRGK
jgi:hypothetical protein